MDEQTDINAELLAALKAICMNGGTATNEMLIAARAAIARADECNDGQTCYVGGKRYRILLGGRCGAYRGLPSCVARVGNDNDLRCADFPDCGCGNWQEDNHA
ncbi:MAG: hypothetical protein FJ006_12700 [Chloroflexi bacterium]|nr:hypothetical protein [Chloroflexota bacterium]